MPYFMGALADRYSTALSYLLPLLCFAVVLVYGLRQRRAITCGDRSPPFRHLPPGPHQDGQRQQQHQAGQ
ncbi:hypothetical protein ISX56_35135, partial [Serratia ureilytica]|nr:hypothetical protein [Serratia ureilytica]